MSWRTYVRKTNEKKCPESNIKRILIWFMFHNETRVRDSIRMNGRDGRHMSTHTRAHTRGAGEASDECAEHRRWKKWWVNFAPLLSVDLCLCHRFVYRKPLYMARTLEWHIIHYGIAFCARVFMYSVCGASQGEVHHEKSRYRRVVDIEPESKRERERERSRRRRFIIIAHYWCCRRRRRQRRWGSSFHKFPKYRATRKNILFVGIANEHKWNEPLNSNSYKLNLTYATAWRSVVAGIYCFTNCFGIAAATTQLPIFFPCCFHVYHSRTTGHRSSQRKEKRK